MTVNCHGLMTKFPTRLLGTYPDVQVSDGPFSPLIRPLNSDDIVSGLLEGMPGKGVSLGRRGFGTAVGFHHYGSTTVAESPDFPAICGAAGPDGKRQGLARTP